MMKNRRIPDSGSWIRIRIAIPEQNIDKIFVLSRSPPPAAPVMSPAAKAGSIDRRSLSMATTDTEVGYIVLKNGYPSLSYLCNVELILPFLFINLFIQLSL